MLSVDSQQKVEQLLLKNKLVSQKQLDDARTKAAKDKKPLLTVLTDDKLVSSEELTKILARATKLPYVNLLNAVIKPEILKLLNREIAEQYMAVPVGEMQGRLAVAMLDPNNVQAVDFLSSKIGKPLTVFVASQEGINNILSQYSSDVQADVTSEIATSLKDNPEAAEISQDEKNIATIVQDSPITRALKTILDYAVNARASDVHIEPTEDSVKIRCRVDGILKEIMKLPKSIEPALISRVKILSNLKIDEHRIPQDGQFQIKSGNKGIDLRVAVAPVVWGEQVVMRLLDKDDKTLTLEDLGVHGQGLQLLGESIKRPHGMILSTGPTGSGKSTTLYSLIQMIKNDSINIVTLEDPVERKIEGVNQIQVNQEVGLTFANGLRSILRQDPDVVLVGEIRDKETATLAVQAALTGHLVLSTLHTNSAAGVLPRLLDMGIEPFLIASTVNTVIGQRLVRRIGGEKEEYKSNLSETKAIQHTLATVLPKTSTETAAKQKQLGYDALPLSTQNAYTLFKGKSTTDSPGGYKGRVGIFEVFNMSGEMEKLLAQHATSSQVQMQAEKQGMLTMKRDGYLKALNGITSLSEVERVAAES